jgi:uncharacterized membrane protein
MTVRELAWTTLAVAVILFPADMIWLKTMRPVYEAELGSMLRPDPRIAVAALFYVVYAIGIAFFAVVPNLQGGTWVSAALHGALLGLVAYGTYDASNFATLNGYSLKITVIDWSWGIVLSAVAAGGAWLLRTTLLQP